MPRNPTLAQIALTTLDHDRTTAPRVRAFGDYTLLVSPFLIVNTTVRQWHGLLGDEFRTSGIKVLGTAANDCLRVWLTDSDDVREIELCALNAARIVVDMPTLDLPPAKFEADAVWGILRTGLMLVGDAT